MKKKGFTLVEVVVSILLVVMLIGMTYGAITVSLRYSSKYDLQRDALHEIQNLRTLLRADNIPAALNLYIGCDDRDLGHQPIADETTGSVILYYSREGTLLGWDDGKDPVPETTAESSGDEAETTEPTAAPYVPLRERAAWKITLTKNGNTWTLGNAETTGGTVLYENK